MIERLRVQIPAGAAGEFSSPELLLFGVPSAPVLRQWHVKDPGHSAKKKKKKKKEKEKWRWQITLNHAYTLDSTKSEWALSLPPHLSLSLDLFLSHSIHSSRNTFSDDDYKDNLERVKRFRTGL